MRDNVYLKEKMEAIWQTYFADVERPNDIHILFGRYSKRRLASIRQIRRHDKNSDTIIHMTQYFKDEAVPEYVIEATIGHELCHYVHGFASPHDQITRHPHRGSIVDNELKKRGLGSQLKLQDKWLKESWPALVGDNLIQRPRVRRHYRRKSPLIRLLEKFVI